MDQVEKILRKNSIEPVSIESPDLSPEDSRRSYVVNTGSATYHLSFPRDRDTPIQKKSVEQRINAEVYSLDVIGRETCLRTPEVVDHSRDYILLKQIEGERTINVFRDSAGKKQEQIARSIGSALAEVHSIEQPGIGYFDSSGLGEEFGSWKKFFYRWVQDVTEAAETDMEERAAAFLERNIDLVDVDVSPVVVYGDFQPWNTVSKEDEVLGVIDGESAFSGHKEYDLAQSAVAWSDKFSVTDSFLEGYRAGTGLEKGWRRRHDYYKVYLFTSSIIGARAVDWTGLVDEFEQRLESLLKRLA